MSAPFRPQGIPTGKSIGPGRHHFATHAVTVDQNIRYNFIHHPLSDVFLVYNDSHYVDLERPTTAQVPSRALVLKVTHLFSFSALPRRPARLIH